MTNVAERPQKSRILSLA